ncbi:HAMP domain-containing sensor histidine kinase [Halorubrum sp. AD140]|uniref:sensor histidine kinase n=1 Tax=Halorubrum sp. AD140 TaxID=3050073 RepID=UPI002ACC6006|nr:HAMP domain-containing sensor histidine kinase [Halorubrum sp. AD140]MDZ5812735.1 HAMP domain-containing sensor histidine kinase [Halorubrum sp. AD140]
MTQSFERRPGVAYRRPDGDPDRVVVEAAGEPRLDVDAMPRTDWLRSVAEEDRRRLREALDGDVVDVTYRLAVGDESTWVRECGRYDERGDVVGYLLPASDDVERRRQLERERERLEEFASVVSHDLRNPLSVAAGNIELARELEGEAADERLDRAQDALDWMDELISDLLALAREGRSVEETETADLRPIVDQAWGTIESHTGVELVVDGHLPTVECDRSRLRQVFENLFRNAIEHAASADGAPDDEANGDSRRTGSPAGASLRVFVGPLADGFYVEDDGPGIPEDRRKAVFEPGHTTDDGGTGFGLAIVERVAEAHGWSVSATEGRTGGARFEFEGVEVVDDGAGGSSRGGVATESGGSSRE